MQIWKNIKGYKKMYQVNKLGQIKSLLKYHGTASRILKQFKTPAGYMTVGLLKNKIFKKILVHRLVIETFGMNKNFLMDVHHINGNKSDNCYENLKWITRSEHMKVDNRFTKLFINNSKKVKQLSLCNELINIWKSSSEAGRNKYSQTCVNKCCNGNRKTHAGFKWQYYNKGDV